MVKINLTAGRDAAIVASIPEILRRCGIASLKIRYDSHSRTLTYLEEPTDAISRPDDLSTRLEVAQEVLLSGPLTALKHDGLGESDYQLEVSADSARIHSFRFTRLPGNKAPTLSLKEPKLLNHQ